jgi:hypothetical protein
MLGMEYREYINENSVSKLLGFPVQATNGVSAGEYAEHHCRRRNQHDLTEIIF